MTGSNKTCAFFVLYLHTQALFPFSFQFFPRLGSVFAEEVGGSFFAALIGPIQYLSSLAKSSGVLLR